jgi:hypothetical protein
VGTATATSYKTATLSAGVKYYWKVVAKNSAGSASSAVWSFTAGTSTTVASTPTPVSASPSSGSALYQVFNLVYSDPNGYQDLSKAYVLFNSSLTSTGSCWASYDTTAKSISLLQDNGVWGATPAGSAATLQNSQCSIAGSGVTVTGSVNNLTIRIAVTFKTSFAGTKNIYMIVNDRSGHQSAWVSRGTWTVPASATPVPVSASPSSGSGISQTFSFVFSDPYGYQSLAGVHALVNSTYTGTNACWIYYDAVNRSLWLAQDSAGGWNSIPVGSTATLQNSQCAFTGSGVSATGSGTNLTLKIPLTFKAAFAGAKNVYMDAKDRSGLASASVLRGTWTVQ